MERDERKGSRTRSVPLRFANVQSSQPRKTNAERCKEWRERIQQDPVRCIQEKESAAARYQKFYKKERTEEELAILREKNRIKAKAYRDRKLAKKAANRAEEPAVTRVKKLTRRAQQQQQREEWRKRKASERDRWNPQQWHHHRERCRANYQARKENINSAAGHQPQDPSAVPVIPDVACTSNKPAAATLPDSTSLVNDLPSTSTSVASSADSTPVVSVTAPVASSAVKGRSKAALYRTTKHLFLNSQVDAALAKTVLSFLRKGLNSPKKISQRNTKTNLLLIKSSLFCKKKFHS